MRVIADRFQETRDASQGLRESHSRTQCLEHPNQAVDKFGSRSEWQALACVVQLSRKGENNTL